MMAARANLLTDGPDGGRSSRQMPNWFGLLQQSRNNTLEKYSGNYLIVGLYLHESNRDLY